MILIGYEGKIKMSKMGEILKDDTVSKVEVILKKRIIVNQCFIIWKYVLNV